MTFCVALRTQEGLVALSDTRLTSGDLDFVVTSKKVFTFENKDHSMFIMLSGLKSISDMVITYLNERKDYLFSCVKLYQGVDLVAKIIREVKTREEQWLSQSTTEFEINYLIGGQFPEDNNAQLFRIYPEGSWKRISQDSPFEIIGEGKYGKYILEYAARYENSMEKAMVLSLLAFDATRKSYPLCSPPLDVLTYPTNSYRLKQKTLTEKQIQKMSGMWDAEINIAIDKLIKHTAKSLLT
jgi:putative proteasome-type protease